MGSKTSSLLRPEEIQELCSTTGFSSREIVRLYHRFCCLDKTRSGVLRREDLQNIPEFSVNPLCSRVIETFFWDADEINFHQFAVLLSTFRPIRKRTVRNTNSKDGKIQFLFRLYDVDKDGRLSKEDFKEVLSHLVGECVDYTEMEKVIMRAIDETGCDIKDDAEIFVTYEQFKMTLEHVDIETRLSMPF